VATLIAVPAIATLSPRAATAQSLEQTGTLAPMENRHTFEGTAGSTVTIRLRSEAFDTVMALLGPDGAELATNDDADRSLNSRIVYELPSDGTYTVLARSFGGNGGDYTVTVNPATDLEIGYAKGEAQMMEGDYAGAAATFSSMIANHSNDPLLHWYRGDAYISHDHMDEAIADYRRASELYRQQGDTENADLLQAIANDLANPTPYPEEPMPR
jgi:tetratricopeptide (TPR) repeat protein